VLDRKPSIYGTERMMRVQEEAASALKRAAEDMKRFFDRKHRRPEEYNVGDQVWLDQKFQMSSTD